SDQLKPPELSLGTTTGVGLTDWPPPPSPPGMADAEAAKLSAATAVARTSHLRILSLRRIVASLSSAACRMSRSELAAPLECAAGSGGGRGGVPRRWCVGPSFCDGGDSAGVGGGPLFSGLPEPGLRRRVPGARRRTFRSGEVLFHRGDPGDSLHLVVKGRFAA